MNPVEEYISNKPDNLREVMTYLHFLISSQDGITSKLGYGIPFYSRKKPICYVNPIKNKKVELCFYFGKLLVEQHKILSMRDRKQVAGIYIEDIANIPEKEILKAIESAIKFDESRSK